jgi:hypothetical protein
MSGSFQKLAGVAAGAFAAAGVVNFAKGAIASASDLNETVSKARTIFGPAAADLEAWASGAAEAIGQSKSQALDATATFGNLFVQLGIGSDHAAKMSKGMVTLASDFASFHNADPTEVIEAQTAAFRGEYDALQRFVPTINAAAVQQQALAMSGKSVVSELTEQDKALAVNALMVQGAGQAAGDFARTSDGLANKQRIQAAEWADLSAKIGGIFLPIAVTVSSFIVDKLVPGIESLIKWVRENSEVIAAAAIGIAAVLVPAFVAWAAAAAVSAAATLAAIAPVVALGLAIGAGALLIIKNWDTIKGAFVAVFDWIKANWPLLVAILTGPFGIAVLAIVRNRDTIMEAITSIPGRIAGAFSGVAEALSAPFRSAFNGIARLWNNTVGRLSFEVPGWVPGIGGKGWNVPNIPVFDNGGVMPGPRGVHSLAMVAGGETILPTHKRGMRAGGAPGVHLTVNFNGTVVGGRAGIQDLTEMIRSELLDVQRRNPTLGFH